MEKNCIEEFPSSNNYRGINFTFNNINYEMNVSLYSNAIMLTYYINNITFNYTKKIIF